MNHPLVKFGLRAAITAAAIYLAFSQVSLTEVMPHLKSVDPLPVLLAFVMLNISQIIAALRTSYYLANRDIAMSAKPAIQLQYIGTLFNALLPGGVGGDAYKAWWLKKHAGESLTSMVMLMLAGRLNGMWPLGIIICALALMSAPIRGLMPYAEIALLALMIGGTLAYHALARVLFKEKLIHQYTAGLRYSLPLQLLLTIAAWGVMDGLGFHAYDIEYLVLFQLSCVLAMLPISIGGLGIRELTLLHGSQLLHISPEHGVALALIFSLLSIALSLVGAVVYFICKPTAVDVES